MEPPHFITMHAQLRRPCKGLPTNHGCFIAEEYYALGTSGVHMRLLFEADASVRATKVGLTQAVRSELAGESKPKTPAEHETTIGSGAAQGWHIDQAGANPLYAANSAEVSATDTRASTSTNQDRGQHGRPGAEPAILIDSPMLEKGYPRASQTFETAALALDGADSGKYLGSVRWGWTLDENGTFEKLKLEVISLGVPSETFLAAAERWNRAKVGSKGVVTRDHAKFWTELPQGKSKGIATELNAGEQVTVIGGASHEGKPMTEVYTGKFGYMNPDDLRLGEKKALQSINLPTWAEVRTGRSGNTPLIATLGERAQFTVVGGGMSFGTIGALASSADTYDVEVEFDAHQPGVTLASPNVFGGKLRGFMQRSKYEALQV